MGTIRKISKGFGQASGGFIGGTVKYTGKKLNNEWVQEVGESIITASASAMDNAGQMIDGTAKGLYGLVTKDKKYQQEGLDDLKDSAKRTVKGIGSTLIYTAQNAGTTVKGMASGNNGQTLQGLKNLGKVAAVSMLAVGVLDFIDGPDIAETEDIDTRNAVLDGAVHPETGVPFEDNVVILPNGDVVEGTFPVFNAAFEAEIPEESYLESDQFQFSVANEQLYQGIMANPELANELHLSTADVQSLLHGETPEGYTWHHHEEPGLMQLVNEDEHKNTGHTGGREIWGGGAEHR
ncbi:HNH endonuclease [Fictibacillus sp. WQ 8-8]|uniref:HNH endonuclease n=1 Tax=Fictibacillus sp. WQ 8-8 TaxID=2938788 RepID=UPI00210BCEC0|nr:HNH endonuclease [Fictibacillus sp. WQ 8-8]MCQ6264717.1 HNH endonuclease [Fictibacillus sp. WQ 8-8]